VNPVSQVPTRLATNGAIPRLAMGNPTGRNDL
jgi:hypothetical protein